MRNKRFWGLICLLLIIAFLFSACLPANQSSPEIKATVVKQTIAAFSTQYTSVPSDITPEEMATLKPAFTPRPTYTPTPTEEVCVETQGQIELREIVIPETSRTLAFRVYLPACYKKSLQYDYPVLYLLHGQSYKDDQWDRLGVDEAADRLIAAGEVPPFIIVMPFESNYLEDTHTSLFGQQLIDNLIPWVDDDYDTCHLRECRAIGGLSRGAGWAIHLGLINWKLFGSIGAHSLAIFSGDFYNAPYWFREIPADSFPRIYMDDGSQDYLLESAKRFEDRLTKYHVAHEWIINTGAHNEEYWAAHVEDYLYWYTFPWKGLPEALETASATPNSASFTATQASSEEK
ncbi:MAG: esterase family protein [Chloroflexi bacterium]|nr:esterase family protein [Chloroflexota bacterium]